MARELILNLNKNKSTFGISKIDRKKSDQLEKEAHDISVKIDAIDSKQ